MTQLNPNIIINNLADVYCLTINDISICFVNNMVEMVVNPIIKMMIGNNFNHDFLYKTKLLRNTPIIDCGLADICIL